MTRKKILITQSNYIPWKGYFDSLQLVDEAILFDDVQYTRRDWRNRNLIKTSEGAKWLTIPVEVKGNFTQRIRDTRIADRDWARRHWKTCVGAYQRAQGFKEVSPALAALYERATSPWLSEINELFLRGICELLGISTPLRRSQEFELIDGKTERLVHLCRQAAATDYYTGPAARAYIDESLFTQVGISVHYLDYSGYSPYRQLHGEFIHEVSILDLLFNEGKNASSFLKSSLGGALKIDPKHITT